VFITRACNDDEDSRVQKMRLLGPVLATAIVLVSSAPALATGTLRCATHVVDQGMSKDEVVAYCGEPALRKDDQYWFYDRGSSMLMTRVFFVDDKVQFIDEVRRDEM
jgi:hypothetical protein